MIKTKQVVLPLCHSCGEIIRNETDGVVVQGNIWEASCNVEQRKGLIGDGMWLTPGGIPCGVTKRPLTIADVPVTAWCWYCFKKKLNMPVNGAFV